MMRTLIWKEVLANRFPLLLAAALLVATYGVVTIVAGLDPFFSAQLWRRRVASTLFLCSLASHAAAQFSLAVLAGNLVAVERVNRSAEFFAYLPASRSRVLQAKASVLVGTAFILFVIPVAICGLTAWWFAGIPSSGGHGEILLGIVSISAAGFCASGIGWLGSCILESNTVAVLFAIIVPCILALIVTTAGRDSSPSAILLATNLSVGLAGFLFGTRHYLHRVEP
jgi:ABC-type transport system involved in multi-copper enzyme maturation permease subunit